MDSTTNNLLTPRLAWMIAKENGVIPSAICRKFGISRKTLYKWWERYRKSGKDSHSLLDRPRRPHRFPKIISKEIVEMIYSIRTENPKLGPVKISRIIKEKTGMYISVRTIWKWLDKRERGIPYPNLPQDNFETRTHSLPLHTKVELDEAQ